jgi:hypothetical protein
MAFCSGGALMIEHTVFVLAVRIACTCVHKIFLQSKTLSYVNGNVIDISS